MHICCIKEKTSNLSKFIVNYIKLLIKKKHFKHNMSSSMFIENNSVRKDAENYLPSSNLVVVYGKSGISFDERGLDNLIEEKKISSISVIRLTSPTPSMKEEEMETAKLEEMLRRQELSSDDDIDENFNNSQICEEKDKSGSESVESNIEEDVDKASNEETEGDQDSSDEKREKMKMKKKPRRRGRIPNALKLKQLRSKPKKKDRPEVIGLHVEEFYPPEEAHEIIKEALKIAGVNSDKINDEDYHFQLLVIQNDHCYTPFTSPSQMKAKKAIDKVNAQKQLNIRKTGGALPSSASLLKKLQGSVITNQLPNIVDIKEKLNKTKSRVEVNNKEKQRSIEDDFTLNVEGVHILNNGDNSNYDDDSFDDDAESLLIQSDDSAESDNDRDSDLDFDVNNRNGRKRKVKIIKNIKRSIGNNKLNVKVKRTQINQEEMNEIPLKQRQLLQYVIRPKISKLPTENVMPIMVRSIPTKLNKGSSCTTSLTKIIQNVDTKSNITSAHANNIITPKNINVLRKLPIQSVQLTPADKGHETYTSSLKHSKQPHKEIVIHKVFTSPKSKGFTDLKELFDQTENNITADDNASSIKSSQILIKTAQVSPKKPSPSIKSFMPLPVETSTLHKLPSQISIQTIKHPPKVDIECDKQLDLIDSIVQNDLQQSAKIDSNNKVDNITTNENNIPELVKMLKNAEQSLQSQSCGMEINQMSINNDNKIDEIPEDKTRSQVLPITTNTMYKSSTAILTSRLGDIDITNAPLLASSDGELPDDILQNVVELIEADKSLQEVVEKEIFDTSELIPDSTSLMNEKAANSNSPSLTSHQTNKSIDSSKESSIMPCRSNNELDITSIANSPHHTYSISQNKIVPHNVKSSPVTRKKPIQIIRNNGRVITLPPIEAPTTRAKRREQTLPASVMHIDNIINRASLDTTLQSNASPSTPSTPTQIPEKKSISQQQNRRRQSKEVSLGSGSPAVVQQKVQKRRKSSKKTPAAKQAYTSNVESADDDDDPNKLWCICRQPHNNRFMICCDECEDWFHGTCVNISKAMGLEMEQKGIDWTCPKCIAKQQQKSQPKISYHFKPSQTSSNVRSEVTATISNIKPTSISNKNGQQTEAANEVTNENSKKKRNVITKSAAIPVIDADKESKEGNTFCIVCKAKARPSSIYCSDDCIRKHAQTALNTFIVKSSTADVVGQISVNGSSGGVGTSSGSGHIVNKTNVVEDKIKKKSKGSFEDLLSMADRKPKIERVHVFERKSGKILMGSSAPTTSNLKKWLQENPTFEIVQPGSAQALDIERKQKQKIRSSSITNINGTNVISVPTAATATAAAITTTTTTTTVALATTAVTSQKRKMSYIIEETDGVGGSSLEKPLKKISEYVKASSSSPIPRPTAPRDSLKSDKIFHPKTSSDEGKSTANSTQSSSKDKDKNLKRGADASYTSSNTDISKKDSEPIRLNVRRILKEQLLLRYKENSDDFLHDKALINLTNMPKLTVEELEEFAKATELEMYNYFNKDTGAKYRAKYRSLIFNIKDRKNHTLFAKICGKLLQPKQLVRMSPEEMASQELAQWRENEAKHQLEIIKKSELDLLSCTKNYVVKTHKGEEVIEEKFVTVPSSAIIPEDLINNPPSSTISNTLNSSPTVKNDSLYTKISNKKDNLKSTSFKSNRNVYSPLQSNSEDEKCKTISSSKQKKKNTTHDMQREHERERHYVKRSSSKHRHRDKSRSHKRTSSNSRSRSRSRGRERERHSKNAHKGGSTEKHCRDETTKYSHKDQHERDKKAANYNSSNLSKAINESKDKQYDVSSSSTQLSLNKKLHHQQAIKHNETSLGAFSLIDQILESTKTVEQAANLVVDKKPANTFKIANTCVEQASSSTPSAPLQSQNLQTHASNINNFDDIHLCNEGDQEPTSTVFIPTPPQDPYARFIYQNSPIFSGNGNHCNTSIWTGIINMIDVASFQIIIQSLLGNHININKLLPNELEVVGRISPDTVWDYITKIKKSPNKEIVTVLLIPLNESETSAYTILYQYLENRNRLGVLKTTSPYIKDFYIYPLGCGKSMPMILKSTECEAFSDDPYRPDILIGIIIRVINKRSHQTTMPISNNHNKFIGRSDVADAHTIPESPKFIKKQRLSVVPKSDEIDVDAIIKAPIGTKNQMNLPTSINTVNDSDEPYSPRSSDEDLPLVPIKIAPSNSNDIKTPTDDDLKRKMDEINRQIAAQEMEIVGLLDTTTFASTSANTNVLANISIPSNLSQILASIKPTLTTSENSHLEVTPPPPPLIGPLMKQSSNNPAMPTKEITENSIDYNINENFEKSYNTTEAATSMTEIDETPSRLAQLSEAELLSMVPDDIMIMQPSSHTINVQCNVTEPPPPGT